MSKSIDNFLSKSERDLISSFIEKSIKNSCTIEHKTKTKPPPLDTKDLTNLYEKKYSKWKLALDAQVPNTPYSYRTALKKNKVDCPIEIFLNNLKVLIEQKNPPYEQKNLLQDFEDNLKICEESAIKCPCPAKLNEEL